MPIVSTISRQAYRHVLKPYFFNKDPEYIHEKMVAFGKNLGSYKITRSLVKSALAYEHHMLEQNLWGIDFKNPVGLAAGFDKNAELNAIMGSVGFGFATVGSVTCGSYEGNPAPRLVRLPKSKGILVNYGLKNQGADFIAEYISHRHKDIPQVISIGKTNSKDTVDRDRGIEDYYECLKTFVDQDVGDIYEINISCPNTFGGEPFTNKKDLTALFNKLFTLNIEKPVFIKMPISLPFDELKELISVCVDYGIKAIVLGNLRKEKSGQGIEDALSEDARGGISGKPTERISNDLIAAAYQYAGDNIRIIGVGGVFSAKDAYQKIKLGATMIELITGLIYEGPQLVREINRGLVKLLQADGFENIEEAVGSYFKS